VAYDPFIINDVQLTLASNVLFQPPQSRLDQFLVPAAGEEASQSGHNHSLLPMTFAEKQRRPQHCRVRYCSPRPEPCTALRKVDPVVPVTSQSSRFQRMA